MWVHAPEPNQILPLWNILRYILNCFYCKDISSRVEGNGTFTVQINACKVNKIITRTSRHHTLSNWPLNRGKSNCYTIKSNRPWIISQPTFLLWRDAHLEYAMSYFKLSVPLSQTFFFRLFNWHASVLSYAFLQREFLRRANKQSRGVSQLSIDSSTAGDTRILQFLEKVVKTSWPKHLLVYNRSMDLMNAIML